MALNLDLRGCIFSLKSEYESSVYQKLQSLLILVDTLKSYKFYLKKFERIKHKIRTALKDKIAQFKNQRNKDYQDWTSYRSFSVLMVFMY